MSYPRRLLPKPSDSILPNASTVEERDLLRGVFKPLNSVLDTATGRLLDTFFGDPSINARDVSTNLFGTFRIEHLGYEIVGPNKAYWTYELWPEGENISVVPADEWSDRTVYGVASGRVADLNTLTFTVKVGDRHADAYVRVSHTPCRANVHHFSIRCYDGKGRDVAEYVGQGRKSLNQRQKALLYQFRRELREKFGLNAKLMAPSTGEPYLGED